MAYFRTFLMTSALALTATGAMADLTAEQAWDDFVDFNERFGSDVAFENEARSGDTLTITGLTISAGGSETATSETRLDNLVFVEQGDGTVRMDMPGSMDISSTATVTGDSGETVEVTTEMQMTHQGLTVVLSGDGVPQNYDFAADEIALEILSITSEGADVPEPPVDLSMTMAGLEGVYSFATPERVALESSTTIDSLTYNMAVEAPEGDPDDADVSLSGGAEMLVARGTTRLPDQAVDMADIAAAIDAGFAFDGSISFENGRSEMAGTSPDGSFSFASGTGSGQYQFAMGVDGLDFRQSAKDLTMTVGGSMVPLPSVTLAMAEAGGRIQMPTLPSDSPQRFGISMNMTDFVLPEAIWSLFDPAAVLPRDPATINIDVSGLAVLAANIFDPAFAESGAAPGEVTSLNINNVTLSLAGAELTGDGVFTSFNMGPDGTPSPAGTINAMLKGGNGLLDGLVTMGLIPEEQAMGARMMVGMFARPGDGEDTLTTTIEMTEDGRILANGQRIK